MNVKLGHEKSSFKCILTTDHASCSYGQPVLLIHGIAHGPLDWVEGPSGKCSAAHLVRILEIQDNTPQKKELCEKFMDIARLNLKTAFERQSYDYLP